MLLAGCSSDWMAAREQAELETVMPPPSYRVEIVAFMRTYLNNPAGVRDAFVTEPSVRSIDHVDRYSVCLRYNARKSNGQYAGSRDSIVLYRSGRLDRIVDNGRELCKDAAYVPFHELETMSR